MNSRILIALFIAACVYINSVSASGYLEQLDAKQVVETTFSKLYQVTRSLPGVKRQFFKHAFVDMIHRYGGPNISIVGASFDGLRSQAYKTVRNYLQHASPQETEQVKSSFIRLNRDLDHPF
uniref:DUF2059 domain-containing protein n=1 Tax=Panagrellus redivivus TaxID=6233 RepID=A0A7E4VG24_PANRE